MPNPQAVFPLAQALSELEQYREPFCHELAGQNLQLCMDTQAVYWLRFLDRETLTFGKCGESMRKGRYACLKMNENTYLISIDDSAAAHSVIIDILLDLQAGLVTAIFDEGAYTSCEPTQEIVLMGAIMAPGHPLPVMRHEYASDLDGQKILWRCGPHFAFAHTFLTRNSLYVTMFPPSGTESECVCDQKANAAVIRIREDVYLITSSIPGPYASGDRLLVLADMNTLRCLGRYFSTCGANRQSILFSAFGVFLNKEENACAPAFQMIEEPIYMRRIVGKRIENPVSRHPSPGGLRQYIQPLSGELAGTFLDLYLEGLPPLSIRFLDSHHLFWRRPGEDVQLETYKCVKGDDTTFLVSFLLSEEEQPTCITLVFSPFEPPVTAILSVLGKDEGRPRLVTSRVFFGAQKQGGKPLSPDRHGYTVELIGKRVIWRYNPNEEVMHIFYSKTHLRLGATDTRLIDPATEEQRKNFQRYQDRKGVYPYYEEPAYYIRIKEGMYLYSAIEATMNRLLPKQGGGELIALFNAKQVRYVGRTFGLNACQAAEIDIVGAIGRFWDVPDAVESIPFPIYQES